MPTEMVLNTMAGQGAARVGNAQGKRNIAQDAVSINEGCVTKDGKRNSEDWYRYTVSYLDSYLEYA